MGDLLGRLKNSEEYPYSIISRCRLHKSEPWYLHSIALNKKEVDEQTTSLFRNYYFYKVIDNKEVARFLKGYMDLSAESLE